MDKIVLFGNQSTARDLYFCLKSDPHYGIAGFTVDKEFIDSDSLLGLPVLPFEDVKNVFPPHEHKMFIAVGYVQNNRIRKERYFQAKEMGYTLINYISPTSVIVPGTIEGDNCFIGHYAVISAGARVGHNVIIGSGSTIGHDVIIGDHCFFSNSVAIAGSVNIGTDCYIGTHATIRNKITIGEKCVIGAGAVLLENAPERSVYLGEPAKLLPISSDKLPLG